jgi:hypothetical protein
MGSFPPSSVQPGCQVTGERTHRKFAGSERPMSEIWHTFLVRCAAAIASGYGVTFVLPVGRPASLFMTHMRHRLVHCEGLVIGGDTLLLTTPATFTRASTPSALCRRCSHSGRPANRKASAEPRRITAPAAFSPTEFSVAATRPKNSYFVRLRSPLSTLHRPGVSATLTTTAF